VIGQSSRSSDKMFLFDFRCTLRYWVTYILVVCLVPRVSSFKRKWLYYLHRVNVYFVDLVALLQLTCWPGVPYIGGLNQCIVK